MDQPDYYGILGVPFGTTPEQIERAYKLLVRMSHPDAFPNGELRGFVDRALRFARR